MKRLWVGVGLLLILLGVGIFTAVAMRCAHEPVSRQLSQAAQAALAEDWGKAEKLSKAAKEQWQQHWRDTASVADHEPMEEIDSLFAELEVYLEQKEAVHFAACCQSLSTLTKAVGEAHTINWWNLM